MSEMKLARKTQQRAEDTRAALLETAVRLFSLQGIDGPSARNIEADAGVQRGAIGYHFENKEGLWKACIDFLCSRFDRHFQSLEATIRDLDIDDRIRASVAAFVRFSAENPELNRIVGQEGGQQSWRLDYIIESFKPRRAYWLEKVLGLTLEPHFYYVLVGAGAFVFDAEYECRAMFGIDPKSDDFIRKHASTVADLLIAMRASAPAA